MGYGPQTTCADLLPARDPVEDQLRDAGVAAHHDEHGRREAAALAGLVGGARPGLVVFLVVAVEADERRLELLGQLGHPAGHVLGLATLLRQAVLHMRPQVPVHRDERGHGVVGDRHARHLDDAALDGVDQREVAHHPREQREAK